MADTNPNTGTATPVGAEHAPWQFVKHRTADPHGGSVYTTADRTAFRRTGGPALREEAAAQRGLHALGFPVPRLLDQGPAPQTDTGDWCVVEESLGECTLHDLALATARDGHLADEVVDQAASVGARLLTAQARHPLPGGHQAVTAWQRQAGWLDNVLTENPDLDNSRLNAALEHAVDRIEELPLVHGHLDYGLPNVLPAGVIDWQHHGPAPLGYDTALALEIVAFKGGTKGYLPTPEQRCRYLELLDATAQQATGHRVSPYRGPFLLVKSLFFLALMKPADPTRSDKHTKWHYRRHLLLEGLAQYERTADIDTARFPTLNQFAAGHPTAGHP
ncbi:phosphotransferase [Streptomyces diacarni]|uniref:phosphotransferase family protein n=1 Tax=Streptomyces diacarni TaxID=2800381 RepID=UPI0033D4463B